MVKVEIHKGNYGYIEITAKNHATDPIVCASVSAIMWGLAGTLLNLEPKPDIKEMILNDGNFKIEVNPFVNGGDQKSIDTSFLFADVSLSQIAKKYPQDIEVGFK